MDNDIAVVAGDLVVPTAGDRVGPVAFPDGMRADRLVTPAVAGPDRRGQRGMVSAEWAVGIVAAVAIAGVLLAVVTSGEVQDALLKFLLWVIKGFVSVVD
jgi:uncharacterized protein DUF4244